MAVVSNEYRKRCKHSYYQPVCIVPLYNMFSCYNDMWSRHYGKVVWLGPCLTEVKYDVRSVHE